MIIQRLGLRQFRCFTEQTYNFDARVVVIEGANGSGKSSLLEALHYCCYLRSFRTHLNRELVQLEKDFFFIDVDFMMHDALAPDHVQVGFSGADGKLVKHNQQPVQSYKELITQFRVVTLAADDLELINGAPELRREFLNYALALKDPSVLQTLKKYRQIVDQRNALLQRGGLHNPTDEWRIWTRQLWEASRDIQALREQYLLELQGAVNSLLAGYFGQDSAGKDLAVTFVYQRKQIDANEDFETFVADYQARQFQQETEWRRGLFGAHLDDFSVVFQQKKARIYASRGQQKLLVLLIKIAQLQQLSLSGEPGVLLLDDFMTDFDHDKVEKCIAALKDLQYQMFLSCPVSPDAFLRGVKSSEVCHIKLS